MEWKDFFHLDPITLSVVLFGFIANWIALKKDSKWHSAWIKTHDKECGEYKKGQAGLLSRLTTLTEVHGQRLDRLERHEDDA